MTEKLTLNNGTVLENANAIQSGDLFLYIYGQDMRTVFGLLIEPENTAQITYTMMDGNDVVYEGYTKLIAVRDEGNSLVTSVMRKGAV